MSPEVTFDLRGPHPLCSLASTGRSSGTHEQEGAHEVAPQLHAIGPAGVRQMHPALSALEKADAAIGATDDRRRPGVRAACEEVPEGRRLRRWWLWTPTPTAMRHDSHSLGARGSRRLAEREVDARSRSTRSRGRTWGCRSAGHRLGCRGPARALAVALPMSVSTASLAGASELQLPDSHLALLALLERDVAGGLELHVLRRR